MIEWFEIKKEDVQDAVAYVLLKKLVKGYKSETRYHGAEKQVMKLAEWLSMDASDKRNLEQIVKELEHIIKDAKRRQIEGKAELDEKIRKMAEAV